MEGSGTSFSAVHVTALAAIAKQYNRSIDCDAFKELLKDSTVDLGTEGYDTTYGWGLIDVPEFVSQLMQDSISFSDVSDHWAEDNIYSCVSRGLFYGMGNGMFMPNSAMNRAMAVTALYRLDGLPYLEDSSDPFEDVQTGQWFTGAIDWASANAIVSGTGNGKFAPEKTISRQELAVMLYRYARYQGLNLSLSADLSFNDAEEIAPWAKDAVTWAAGNAIVLGRTNGTFDPNAEASRAEVAAVLVRFTELYE
ncbi:MAG: S-layer homology domain-containing protein, partial [Oscillospiraceae bacterium]